MIIAIKRGKWVWNSRYSRTSIICTERWHCEVDKLFDERYKASILTTSLIFSGNASKPCFEHTTVLGCWLRWHKHPVGQVLWHSTIEKIPKYVANKQSKPRDVTIPIFMVPTIVHDRVKPDGNHILIEEKARALPDGVIEYFPSSIFH